jgi:hypothetical protein
MLRWTSVVTVIVLGFAPTAHADDQAAPALFCVFPQAKPLPGCFKGNSLSEAHVRECEARNARKKKVSPRLRIDGGRWIPFAPDRWRCVRVPADKAFQFQIENYGTLFYSDRMVMPDDCPSRRVDLIRPTFYGSMWAKCSKRRADRDDIVDP